MTPSGFVLAKPVLPRLPAGTGRLQCGKVATRHHALGLRAYTAAPGQEDGEAPAAVERGAGVMAEQGPEEPAKDTCICENDAGVRPLRAGGARRLLQDPAGGPAAGPALLRALQPEGEACTNPKTAKMLQANLEAIVTPTTEKDND